MKDLPIYNIRFYMYTAVVLSGTHTYFSSAPPRTDDDSRIELYCENKHTAYNMRLYVYAAVVLASTYTHAWTLQLLRETTLKVEGLLPA